MSKKPRASNLTYSEKLLLVDLGMKYRNIIDNKQVCIGVTIPRQLFVRTDGPGVRAYAGKTAKHG